MKASNTNKFATSGTGTDLKFHSFVPEKDTKGTSIRKLQNLWKHVKWVPRLRPGAMKATAFMATMNSKPAGTVLLFNANHSKSFKILYMLLYDLGGFRLVECSYHVFTWGLMSQFCLSTKNVPFGYRTV